MCCLGSTSSHRSRHVEIFWESFGLPQLMEYTGLEVYITSGSHPIHPTLLHNTYHLECLRQNDAYSSRISLLGLYGVWYPILRSIKYSLTWLDTVWFIANRRGVSWRQAFADTVNWRLSVLAFCFLLGSQWRKSFTYWSTHIQKLMNTIGYGVLRQCSFISTIMSTRLNLITWASHLLNFGFRTLRRRTTDGLDSSFSLYTASTPCTRSCWFSTFMYVSSQNSAIFSSFW